MGQFLPGPKLSATIEGVQASGGVLRSEFILLSDCRYGPSAKVYGSSGYRWITLGEVVPYSAMPPRECCHHHLDKCRELPDSPRSSDTQQQDTILIMIRGLKMCLPRGACCEIIQRVRRQEPDRGMGVQQPSSRPTDSGPLSTSFSLYLML